MYSIRFLGTGPGAPAYDRCHTSILLQRPGRFPLLLDAGEPCSHVLKAFNVAGSDLGAVFISHGHSDHLAGFPMLVQGCWLEGRSAPLPVYLPGELVDALRVLLDAVYLPEKLIGFPIEYRPWEEGGEVEFDGATISVAPSSHLLGLGRMIDPDDVARFKAYSMALDLDGGRIVYSADIGSPSDLEPLMDRAVSVLICELSHFDPGELIDFLKDREIETLLLNHLSAEHYAERTAILEEFRQSLPQIDDIKLPRDRELFEFTGRSRPLMS